MITIQVKGDRLIPDTIHGGTAGSYREVLMLAFSEEWSSLFCKIDFFPLRGKPVSVIWSENTKEKGVRIPAEVTQYSGIADFTVNGYSIEDGVIGEKRISLTGHIEVDASRRDVNPMPLKPTPNAYEQLRADMVQDMERALTEAKESGEFRGESGVYVGGGDPPEGTRVQVDPEGRALSVPCVTPEMFGAVPAAEGDSTAALRKCIEYAVENRVNVQFASDYRISGTLYFDKKGASRRIPLCIDGGGYRLIASENIPLLVLRGNNLTVCNLTLTYDGARFDAEADRISRYTASMLILEADSANASPLVDGACIHRVRCLSSDYSLDAYANTSVGFEVRCKGADGAKAHAYALDFKSCYAERLGTALKIVMNEFSDGVNGNSYDISSWACAGYVDGPAEGSRFTGVVQASPVVRGGDGEAINPYLIYNIGKHNVFDCMFYDLGVIKGVERQRIIADAGGSVFSFRNDRGAFGCSPLSGDMYSDQGGRVSLPYNPSLNAVGALNIWKHMPLRNSFGDGAVKITSHCEGLYDNGVLAEWSEMGKWGALHDSFDENHMSTKLDVLFRDNPWGRRTAEFRCAPDSVMSFDIEFPEEVRIGAVFINFGNIYEDRGETKIELISENGENTTCSQGTIAHAAACQIGFAEGSGASKKFRLKITFNAGGKKNTYQLISQITGYAVGDSGLI